MEHRQQHLILVAGATFAVACSAAIGVLAEGRAATWPDTPVKTFWPTFASVPRAESGQGGVAGWDGSFQRCTPTGEVSYDYVCSYGDAQGEIGYVCLVAPASEVSASSITAKVAPQDATYGSAAPAAVCDSSLAYTLSQG